MNKRDIQVLKPFDGLIHLVFPNQYLLTSTFIRFQEFYEGSNAKLRGHYFTLDEVMDDYVDQFKKMIYFEHWGGFNMPGEVFNQAFELFKADKRAKEHLLVQIVSEHIDTTSPFYVIATYKGSKASERCDRHETAHSLYYLDPTYRAKVETCLSFLSEHDKKPLIAWLIKEGYGKNVFQDELNSYLIDAYEGYKVWKPFLKNKKVKEVASHLVQLFNQVLRSRKSL